MKLCQIYNCAPHYRQSIYEQINKSFDCDFYFGDATNGIKEMDFSGFGRNVIKVRSRFYKFGFYYMTGVPSLALNKEYDTYIVTGDTHNLSVWMFSLLVRILRPRIKVYFWTHGWYGKETCLQKIVKKLFFKLPTGGIFLYGNYARELMIKEGFNPQKLFVIHNSLSYTEQVSIRKQLTFMPIYREHFGNLYPNLIFVGRLTKIKHLDLVLRAVLQLRENGQFYNITFIGEGESKEELQFMTSNLDLQKNVWFFGSCYNEKTLGEMLYNADICVSPGNLGLTAMHSMVYGTPVITHNDFSRQMPEFEAIIEGVTGTFFDYESVDSLSKSISAWFHDKSAKRVEVRDACMQEIDSNWTPQFQLNVLKQILIQN